MTITPALDPFRVDGVDAKPAPARLEVLEVHAGDRYGTDYPLLPNEIRVNGVPLWNPVDDPIVVGEVRINDSSQRAVVVSLRLQARVLRIGEEPSRVPPTEPGGKRHFATVELPPGDFTVTAGDGAVFHVGPYAIVDGHKLSLAAFPTVERVTTGEGSVVTVTLPLLCRSVVFDDESTGQPVRTVPFPADAGKATS